MPPPLSSQPGSRAGLVTTLAIAVILLLISVLLNFVQNSQYTLLNSKFQPLQAKYNDVIASNFSHDAPEYAWIIKGKGHGTTWIDSALEQTRSLAKLINGANAEGAVNADAVKDEISKFLSDTDTKLKARGITADVAGGSLKDAVSALSNQLLAEAGELDAAKAAQAKSEAQRADDAKTYAANLADREKQVKDSEQKTGEATASANAAVAQAAENGAKVGADMQKLVQDTNAQIAAKDVKISQLSADLNHLKSTYESVLSQLKKYRHDVTDPEIRQADARVIRVGTSHDVFIDIGSDDHVPPGMSMEVYDKDEGIPKLGDGQSPDNMPIGKASIEITNVGQNSSRCRIVKMAPGQQISEGDICVNLVYNRHTKPSFVVYGDFDMTGENRFNAAGADMIKNLVIRWGGTVQKKINAQTDYLVIGKEPEVKELSPEDAANPELIDLLARQKKALADYQNVINEAATYNVPIMNQNRFLYYTGYFDLVKR